MKQIFTIIAASVALVAISVFAKGDVARAQSGDAWLANPVDVVAQSAIAQPQRFNNVPTCNGGYFDYVQFNVDGVYYSACVFGRADEVRMARFHHSSRQTVYAIAFKGDTEFYQIRGLCSYTCAYASKTDTFLLQYPAPYWQRHAGIHREVTKHLTKVKDSVTGEVYYDFQSPEGPETILLGTTPALVESTAFSENGEWLVAEVQGLGILRIQVKTMEMRRIIAPGSTYGHGSDPRVELAITNDGSAVAVMGTRKGLDVYAVTPGCGDRVSGAMSPSFGSDTAACRLVSFDRATHFPRFSYAMYPSFSQDGRSLRAIAVVSDGTYSNIVLKPSTLTADPIVDYIALGDSYTSGEGELKDEEYLAFTNTPPHSCHVSRRSYPFLLTHAWRLNGSSVACSGATTEDVVGTGPYAGQNERIASLAVAEQEALKEQAIAQMYQGVVRQSVFIEAYHPRLITVGIGGNDAGLIGKLRTCLGLDTCEWAQESGLRQAAGAEILAVGTSVREVLRELQRASPASTIVAVGYSEIIKATGSCGGLVGRLLNLEERRFMQEAIRLLNRTLSYAARSEGVHFANIETAYGDAVLCGNPASAVNGVRMGDDIALLGKLKIIGAESFHPTPHGHALAAQAIASQFSAETIAQPCNCLHNAPLPELTPYWTAGDTDGMTDRRLQQQKAIALRTTPGQIVTVSAPTGSFKASSEVVVEIHSRKIELARGVADANGGFSANIMLPPELEEGYHTLFLLGINQSDRAMGLYRFVAHGEEDADGGVTGELAQPGSVGAVSTKNSAEARNQVAHQAPIALNALPKTTAPADSATGSEPPLTEVQGVATATPIPQSPDVQKSTTERSWITRWGTGAVLVILAVAGVVLRIGTKKR